MTRMARQSRHILKQAFREATDLHSPTVEAEHIVLAISSRGQDAEDAADAALREFGLDHDALVGGLDAEFQKSLGAVGIDIREFGDLSWTRTKPKKPKWGTTAMLVVKRAAVDMVLREERRRIEPAHLLLAALQAREGTVPRMLEAMNVDRDALTLRVEAQIAA